MEKREGRREGGRKTKEGRRKRERSKLDKRDEISTLLLNY
jgi:hypothetical protein